MGLLADEVVLTSTLASLEAFFDVVEGLLSERECMAGNEFSLVDIYYIPLVQRLFVCGYGDVIESRGAVNAWWNRCVTRPAIQKMLAADKEAAKVAAAAR